MSRVCFRIPWSKRTYKVTQEGVLPSSRLLFTPCSLQPHSSFTVLQTEGTILHFRAFVLGFTSAWVSKPQLKRCLFGPSFLPSLLWLSAILATTLKWIIHVTYFSPHWKYMS